MFGGNSGSLRWEAPCYADTLLHVYCLNSEIARRAHLLMHCSCGRAGRFEVVPGQCVWHCKRECRDKVMCPLESSHRGSR
jgi:hypothetical protein